MDTLPPLPSIALGQYRHFKGGRYEVLGVVRSSETLEPLVLYRPLESDIGLWCARMRCSSSRSKWTVLPALASSAWSERRACSRDAATLRLALSVR